TVCGRCSCPAGRVLPPTTPRALSRAPVPDTENDQVTPMTSSAQTLPLPVGSRRSPLDWAYAALVLLITAWAFHRYGDVMDVYERAILGCAAPALIVMGW